MHHKYSVVSVQILNKMPYTNNKLFLSKNLIKPIKYKITKFSNVT